MTHMPRVVSSIGRDVITPLMLAVGLGLTACAPAVSSTSGNSTAPASALPVPATRAERTGYLETSSHADVLAFIDTLVARGAPITVRELAQSPSGRKLPLLIASRPQVATPEAARALGRPIVYVQANIHAGEVEGKEAILALLRDWSASRRPTVLDSLVVIVVPIYNADGNEKLADQARNRGEQNGPALVGERPNGQGFDLNRDYIKAEAPETRGSLAAFNAWDPDVFMDLHTTDGSFHGYALTYSPSLHPAAPLGLYTADTLLTEIQRRMQTRHTFATFPYGNFASAGGRGEALTATAKSGWYTYEHKPRYGTNYYGLRGRISILSEAFSHDPFARRVASTRAFVQEALSLVAERRAEVLAHSAAGTAKSTAGAGLTAPVPVRARFTSRPDTAAVLVEVLERLADSTVRTEPGTPRGIRRTGRVIAQRMPVVDRFESALSRTPTAYGYVLAPRWTKAVELLRMHGVPVETLREAMTATVQQFLVDSVAMSARPFQGHREASLTGRWRDTTLTLPSGTLLIPTTHRLGLLAMQLLEPESDDGLVTWNVFDEALSRGALAPVARVVAPLRVYSPDHEARTLPSRR